MSQRIKGQEIVIDVVSPDGLEEDLGNVVSASITYQLDVLRAAFLGETSERRDDIFRGLEGEMEIQLSRRDALRFVDRVKARAQRRTPADSIFSVTMTLNFPDGGSARISLSPVYFGNLPLNVGGRDEYVTLSITFEAQDGDIIFANAA